MYLCHFMLLIVSGGQKDELFTIRCVYVSRQFRLEQYCCSKRNYFCQNLFDGQDNLAYKPAYVDCFSPGYCQVCQDVPDGGIFYIQSGSSFFV